MLKNPRCGLQFGSAPGVRGFIGLIDDVSSVFFIYVNSIVLCGVTDFISFY